MKPNRSFLRGLPETNSNCLKQLPSTIQSWWEISGWYPARCLCNCPQCDPRVFCGWNSAYMPIETVTATAKGFVKHFWKNFNGTIQVNKVQCSLRHPWPNLDTIIPNQDAILKINLSAISGAITLGRSGMGVSSNAFKYSLGTTKSFKELPDKICKVCSKICNVASEVGLGDHNKAIDMSKCAIQMKHIWESVFETCWRASRLSQ